MLPHFIKTLKRNLLGWYRLWTGLLNPDFTEWTPNESADDKLRYTGSHKEPIIYVNARRRPGTSMTLALGSR